MSRVQHEQVRCPTVTAVALGGDAGWTSATQATQQCRQWAELAALSSTQTQHTWAGMPPLLNHLPLLSAAPTRPPVHETDEAVPLKLAAHVVAGLDGLGLAVHEAGLDVGGGQSALVINHEQTWRR